MGYIYGNIRLGMEINVSGRGNPSEANSGELLFRLKYRGDLSAVTEIVEAATDFLRRSRNRFDLIVPVPPSGHREGQHAAEKYPLI